MTLLIIYSVHLSKAKVMGRLWSIVDLDSFSCCSVVLVPHSTILIILIESGGSDPLILQAHRLALVQDPLQAVNQILMVFIAVKYVEAAQHKFVLFLNKLVEKFDIFFFCEVVPGQAVYELQQLLLVLRDRRHWSFHVGAHLLGKPD